MGLFNLPLPLGRTRGLGEFAGATASFTVPSWAPGSSPEVARWACRLVVGRDGRDVDERGEFRVVIGTADVAAPHQPIEHYMGDGALDGPPLHLGKKIPMHGGTEFGLPFALPLPADAAPTSSAVHSSLS